MSTPKVSIIVPVYNTQKYLKRCLDSITKQTLREFEVILVDDGSKEECALLCDEFAKKDERIKVIHKENQGLGFARNTGLNAATGEYIGFVDSDDYIESDMYENLYQAAKSYSAELVISGLSFVGGNTFSQTQGYEKKPCFEKDTLFEESDKKNLLLGVVGALPHEAEDSRYGVSVCKNLFQNRLIQENDIRFLSEREFLSEDTLFMVDFIRHTKRAVGVPGAYYCYCRNESSLSKSYSPLRFEKSLVFLAKLEKNIAETIKKEDYQIYLNRLKQAFGRILCSQEILYARDQKIKFSLLRKRLKKICTQKEIKTALQSYPWYRLPIKQAAFAFAMKHRLYLLQWAMVILRDR